MKKGILLIAWLFLLGNIGVHAGIFNTTITDITPTSATVKWETTIETTTAIQYGIQLADGSYEQIDLPKLDIPDTKYHVYQLNDLVPNSNYRVWARSVDNNMGAEVPTDDNSNPAYFYTLPPAGPVVFLESTPESDHIELYQSTFINGTALSVDWPASGRDVILAITNGAPGGEPRGTFEPAVPVTDLNGNFSVKFTGAHYGKARISITVDEMVSHVDVWVLKSNNKSQPLDSKSIGVSEVDSWNEYILFQNYPNPFSYVTNIGFQLPNEAKVTISVYDILGKKLRDFTKDYPAGKNHFIFDADGLKSGMYFYKLEAGHFVSVKMFNVAK
ncbi:MAG: T9SS type A sorting domain-containing protein [Bacteroidales bacterium]|nr:T9SS type A sorting domain-containing protein [Bacteroidales bacterium]